MLMALSMHAVWLQMSVTGMQRVLMPMPATCAAAAGHV